MKIVAAVAAVAVFCGVLTVASSGRALFGGDAARLAAGPDAPADRQASSVS